MRLTLSALLLAVSAGAGALDLSIDEAVERAVQTAPEVQSLRFQLQSSVVKNQLSYRRYLPSLSLQNNQSQSVRWNQDDNQTVTWSATVKQPVFLGVADLSSATLAEQDFALAQVSIQAAEESARDAAWQAYQSLWMETQKLELYKGLAALAADQLTITKKERELGSAREIDLVETTIETKKADQQVRSQALAVKQAEYALKKLLNIDSEAEVRWTTVFEGNTYRWPASVSDSSLQARALASNLDLKKARAQMQKLQVQRGASELDVVPTLDVEAGFNLSGAGYPLDKPGYSFKLNVRWPFRYLPVQFSLGYTTNPGTDFGSTANTQGALPDDLGFLTDAEGLNFQIDSAARAEAQQREDLAFTVAAQAQQLRLQAEALDTQKELLELGRTKASILKTQVSLGEAKRLDYLKAETDLVNQKLGALEQEKAILLSERALEKVIGLPLGTLARSRKLP